jgi:uncharacterized protein (DUF1800 family)
MSVKPYISIIAVALTLGLQISTHAAMPSDLKVLHAINRLSFGPRPGEIEHTAKIGVERYIEQQLNPNTIPESQTLNAKLARLETVNLGTLQLFEQTQRSRLGKGQKPTLEQRKAYQAKLRHVLDQAMQARLLRATESPRQLQEVMVDFWYNHFNVFSKKGVTRFLVGAYEKEAIRPYAFARFRDLLGSTAHHPAMLFYLDNWQNTAPNSPGARGKAKGLNENYARELMELHTLGVKGGYTQKDVVTLAKILTGWTFRRAEQPNVGQYGFYFDAKRHDYSDKVFMGQTIKGRGMAEGEQAFDILAKHPATARRISYQLSQYFVADQPPQALVERLSQTFLSTDGNLREVLNTLFRSSEFWDSRFYNAKFKTPYQYAVSSLRATGATVTNFRPVVGFLQQAGMPLYGCLAPDGYKNTQESWLNPDAMTRRISFATALASGRLPLLAPPATSPALKGTQIGNTLGNPFSVKTQQAIAASPPPLQAALILGSPEFMRR